MESVASSVLAPPSLRKRRDPNPIVSIKRFDPDRSTRSHRLKETAVHQRRGVRPRCDGAFQSSSQLVEIDAMGGLGHPTSDLPNAALRVDRLLRQQAEQNLRCASAVFHCGSPPHTGT
ncbi:MAG: hypothetical protein R2682_16140 [Pyrinomonadaceae bacterium]